MTNPSFIFGLVVMVYASTVQAEVRVTDDLGRQVVLQQPAQRIAPAGPPAEVLLYVVAPDLMAGWARKQSDETLARIDERAKNLPVLGHITGWEGEPDYSKWEAAKVDLFIDYGSVGGRFETLAVTVQAGTKKPYVVLDGRLEKMPAVFRLMGQLTGRMERAETLAKTAERILAKAASAKEPWPTVYIARGSDGRSAITSRSQHGEIYNVAGAINVAAREERITDAELSAWMPDVIVALTPEVLPVLQTKPWADLPAVQNKRIYVAPTGPWSWVGGPPSVNRLLGLVWLSAALSQSPDWPAVQSEVETLYQQLYGFPLSTRDLDRMFTQENLKTD